MSGERDRANGQYAPTVDRLCVCGHGLSVHTAARSAGEQPCIVGDVTDGKQHCDCRSFRRNRKKVTRP